MNRLVLSFFITLFLYVLLFLIVRIDLQKPPITTESKHRFNISDLRLIKQKPLQKSHIRPKPKSPKVEKKRAKKEQQKQKKKLHRSKKKDKSMKLLKKRQAVKKIVKTSSAHKKTKDHNQTTQATPSLTQLFAKKRIPKKSSNNLPPKLRKLYKDEFESFTKEQKKFIQNNLTKIGSITQKYLYLRGYPYIAVKTKQEGVNIVEFYLHPNGDITNLHIIKSSGYEALDKNSLETIKTAYKDYPLPTQTTKIKIYVRYSIIY
ncbi:periplasmic protein TonB [Nitratiruptor sp. YY08-26]|uniref:energy transducer TonB n=1 Tax=unclassified Nitratiruptor TaxID=2624044 RepID=UPI0019162154|nr:MULTISPECIES: energy transducer TonB [unclassified Nitratiruptor]BCD62034.1 periplasmic protein TonB [Nitratiruptor sp. YY08-13]BCD65970.1 periplasmic protein TonB [Nitratiruptor sp. YY08-26]